MSSSQPQRRTRRIQPKIRQLRLKNDKLPVYRLPLEILTSIFLLAREDADDHKRSCQVLVMSWVSSHWRHAVLSAPSLWNFIDVESNDLVNLFLTRSRDVKLSVRIRRENTIESDPILKELGRLQTLSLMCPWRELPDFILEIDGHPLHCSQPAPFLEKIYLKRVTIPSNPFHNTTPALRHVRLNMCSFDWDTFPFSNLTQLYIIHPILDHPINPAHLVQKIQQMPLLERLMLRGALFETGGPESARVALPKLDQLRIAEVEATTLIDLLKRLTVPPTTLVSVQLNETHDMLPQIIAALRGAQDGVPKQMDTFRLQFKSDPPAQTDDDHRVHVVGISGPSFKEGTLSRWSFWDWTPNESSIDELLSYYDFSSLRSLTLHSNERRASPDIWSTILNPLPQLEKLDLLGDFSVSFIDYFSKSASRVVDLFDRDTKVEDVANGRPCDGMVLPSLKALYLFNRGDIGPSQIPPEYGGFLKWPGNFKMFRFVLEMRKLLGHNILSLGIYQFFLPLEQTEDLKRIVGEFQYAYDLALEMPSKRLNFVEEDSEDDE
ncbi:hypothetical protein BDN72DRAFT_840199 [Pluteus cervinus]|uniref:Uncharacterized protein n=1 Tax=Pluteus cervinus TaxID=181527 RepID=A0ACD3AV15_9AGAR|nr:hypothetical protein BDN72DRAFT_840199 [Pluteus cervinus]